MALKMQSLILGKGVFPTKQLALKWVKRHERFKHNTIRETQRSFRFRQRPPKLFKEGSFRVITIARGVKAIVGELKNDKELK